MERIAAVLVHIGDGDFDRDARGIERAQDRVAQSQQSFEVIRRHLSRHLRGKVADRMGEIGQLAVGVDPLAEVDRAQIQKEQDRSQKGEFHRRDARLAQYQCPRLRPQLNPDPDFAPHGPVPNPVTSSAAEG